jgi:hypothetical protein
MAEVYPFTENNDHVIFNYKQFANVISSARQQNNYDHRFTQVNSFGRTATNCVSDLITYNAVPKIASYKGVDILLKPRLINTYLSQSIITGYKLQGGCIDVNGIDATKQLVLLLIFLVSEHLCLLSEILHALLIDWLLIHE